MIQGMLQGPFRLMGADVSIGTSGWATFDVEGNLLKAGVIIGPPSGKYPYRQRIQAVCNAFRELAAREGVTHLAVEDPIEFGTAETTIKLSKVNGAVCYAVADGLPYVEVVDLNITETRKTMGFKLSKYQGEGREDSDARTARLKRELVAFAQRNWPAMKFETADTAEAALQGLRGVWHVTGKVPIAVKKKKKRSEADGDVRLKATARGRRWGRKKKIKKGVCVEPEPGAGDHAVRAGEPGAA